MSKPDPFQEKKLEQTRLYIYLFPVLGLIPSLWTLSQGKGTPQQKSVSRLSVSLTICWLITYALLWGGASQTSDFLSLRLSYLNALLTSGYFVVSFALMFSIWRGKQPRLSSLSNIAKIVEPKDPY